NVKHPIQSKLTVCFTTSLKMLHPFVKFHGFGNDYIVIEQKDLNDIAPSAEAARLGEFARRICNRHYGAGADGIAVISPAKDELADFHVRIFNPDGSEAGLSGNGT